jgi:hypothetical protein
MVEIWCMLFESCLKRNLMRKGISSYYSGGYELGLYYRVIPCQINGKKT